MSTVLIVDDERLVVSLLNRVLKEAGYTPIEAGSGEQALAILRDGVQKIDLLLTDLKMPGMTGQELAARATAITPGLPVIYMSGFCDRAAAGLDALSGSAEFLEKPFSRSSLLAKILMVLPEPLVTATGLHSHAMNT